MGPISPEYGSCAHCGGTGKTDDRTPCSWCKGTGVAAGFARQTGLETRTSLPSKRRRRSPRYTTDLLLRVHGPERDLDGCCVVIGEGGLTGMLPERLPVGSVVEVRLAVPTHSTVLEVLTVVRCRLELQHGFEFLTLTPPELSAIQQFCKGLAIRSAVP